MRNKKQLYKTALITSPIIAIFESSSIFFLTHQTITQFIIGVITVTILSLILWLINLLVFTIEDTDKWKRYILSYLFLVVFIAFLFITTHSFLIKAKTPLSALFPLINILSLNTIILIMLSNITSQYQKAKIENELTSLKIKHLEAEHQQLIQQLQPHFLFNSFSTLKSIIDTDSELAKEYLVKLSNFLRFTSVAHENIIIPLGSELEFTKNYIGLQQIRFESSLFCDISIPDDIIDKFKVPVYALQSLVENAIKHNAFSDENPLRIDIKFESDNLVVSNNRLTEPQGNISSGIGLNNLGKRYKLSTGENIIIEKSPQSFKVTLKLIRKEDD